MRTEKLVIGKVYKHRSFPDTEYMAILVQEIGGISERKTLMISNPTREKFLGKTVTSDSNTAPDWWDKVYEKGTEIVLNSEYTAVVSSDRQYVTVGCQTFPRSVVAQVAQAMDI